MSDERYQSEALERPTPRQATPRQAMPPTNEPRLTRRRRSQNPMDFDKSIIPPGLSYEWKREKVFNWPDSDHQRNLRENHWTAVPADRHPQLAMAGETVIRRGGDILMQRPKHLTEDAQMEDIEKGLEPLRATEDLLHGTPEGTMTRNHPSVHKVAGIKQQWAPGEPILQQDDGSMLAEP